MTTQNPRRTARTIHPVAPPGSLHAGQRLSAGECDDIQVNKIKAIQTNMLEALDSDVTITGGVEELASMKAAIQRSLKKLTALQAYRAQYPGWDVKAISFSSVRERHYGRLGVATEEAVHEDVFNHLLEILPSSAFRINNNVSVVYPDWQPALDQLDDTMLLIANHVNMQREAGIRMMIDQYILALISACDNDGKMSLFLLPELSATRSRGSDGAKAAEVMNNRSESGISMRTSISGNLDYAVFGVLGRPGQYGDINDSDTAWSQAIDLKAVVESNATFKLFTANGRQFLVIEAKGNPDFVPLSWHLPQVVAQCLAIWLLLEKAHVPFILTQGTSWIFGVVDCALASALDGKGENCVLWHTDEIQSVMREASMIMRPLWLWATLEPIKLLELLQDPEHYFH